MYNEGKNSLGKHMQSAAAGNEKAWQRKRKLFYLIFLKAANPNLLDSMYFSLFAGFKNRASETLSRLFGVCRRPGRGGITISEKSGLTTFEDGIKSFIFYSAACSQHEQDRRCGDNR
jgi:hypothetical protein